MVWPEPPCPYKEAYDRIELGMPEDQVLTLLPDPPVQRASGPRMRLARYRLAFEDWKVLDAGQQVQARVDYDAPPRTHPLYARSLHARLWEDAHRRLSQDDGQPVEDEEGVLVFREQGTHRVLAKRREWVSGLEYVQALLTPDGRVAEMRYGRYRRPFISEQIRKLTAGWGPF